MESFSLARAVIDSRAGNAVRSRIWLNEANNAGQSATSIAKEFGYNNLDVCATELAPDKGHATLFILGGGTSVNALTSGNFQEISQGTSIGINAWAIHEFVPDVFAFETAANSRPDDPDTIYVTKRLNRSEVLTRAPRFLFLRPTAPASPRNLVQVPADLRALSFMYGRANLVTRKPENISSDTVRLLRGYRDGKIPRNVLPDNGATVIRLIYLGILQGFRSIVLVGVDLDSRGYFWQAPEFDGDREFVAEAFQRPVGVPHDTLDDRLRPFPANVAITRIAELARQELGVSVHVGNELSSLSNSIPVFPWSERHTTSR